MLSEDRFGNGLWEGTVNETFTSALVSDWTFEELRQLRLKCNGEQTDYLIPTFEEALQVCKGRTTIRLDKYGVWDWDEDVYPLIKKVGAIPWAVLIYKLLC